MTDNEAGGWARGYAACREAHRTELEWHRAEVEHLLQQLKLAVFADSEECKMLTIENKRLRDVLLEIAQGTNENWIHDNALRALEQSELQTAEGVKRIIRDDWKRRR